MRAVGMFRGPTVLGALALGASTLLMLPAQAQYGGYGYGGGYDRPRPYDDEEYAPRRRPRSDYDEPRRGYDDEPRGGGGSQARGSFVQSCRDIDQDGAYLAASCRMRGGGYARSRIDTRSCRSIGNRDGRLTCE